MYRTLALMSTVTVLLISAAYFGQLSQKRLCINSSLVERIDMVSSAGRVVVPNCQGQTNLGDTPESLARALLQQWEEARPSRVLLSFLGLRTRPIRISIMAQSPLSYENNGFSIKMGVDYWEAHGFVEWAVLEAALIQNLGPEFEASHLGRSVLTDSLLTAFRGQLELADPASGRMTNQFPSVFQHPRRVWQSSQSLCEFEWKLPGQDCLYDFSELLPKASLRALMALLTWREVRELGLSERQEWAQAAIQRLRARDWQKFEALRAASLQDIIGSLDKEHWSSLSRLAPYLIPEESFLVFSDTPRRDLTKSLWSEPHLLTRVVSGGLSQFYPLAGFVKLSGVRRMPKRLAWVRCERSNLGELARLESEDDRLLEIQDCDHTANIDWVSYLKEGPKGFADANPGLKFSVYHLPSVRLAIQLGVSNKLVLPTGLDQVSRKARKLIVGSQKPLGADLFVNEAPVAALEYQRIPNASQVH